MHGNIREKEDERGREIFPGFLAEAHTDIWL
jgi:hypothetical protein